MLSYLAMSVGEKVPEPSAWLNPYEWQMKKNAWQLYEVSLK
jgi:hypothetical protein